MIKTIDEGMTRAREFTENLSNWNYVYGAKYYNNPITQNLLNVLQKQNPGTFTPDYMAKAQTKIGKNAIDCSGLVCRCHAISDIGSYAIAELPKTYPSTYVEVNTTVEALEPMDILWKTGHVALYIGNNKCLEARNINMGVIISDINYTKWGKVIRNKTLSNNDYMYDGWIREPDGSWWYASSKKKGDYYKNCVSVINGKAYAFNAQGLVVKNPTITTDEKGGFDINNCRIDGYIYTGK